MQQRRRRETSLAMHYFICHQKYISWATNSHQLRKPFIPIPRPHFAIQKRIAAPILKRHSQGSQGRSRPMAHFSEGGKVAGRSFLMHLAIKCVHVCLRSDLVATTRVAQPRRYITKHYCSRWRSAIRGLGRFRAIPDYSGQNSRFELSDITSLALKRP